MAQQFDVPKDETELRQILDKLYKISKEAYEKGGRPAFKGLVEIMASEVTIMTAIHNIKANHGSETPGVDGKKMRRNYLQRPYEEIVKEVKGAFEFYEPQEIRRVYIDKPGKAEKRPLGIPIIRDRIVQECIRIVLEPILEAQFFEHSYGFRPMRDTAMALDRITSLTHSTGYHWIVEGDISKCFDKIDHRVLLKRLYHVGIKDKRVIQMLKAMLKAGIMNECEVNEIGSPQGGIVSPLLANAYLDMMDEWVSKQWECKRTNHLYSTQGNKIHALKATSLCPGYIVRYADDFVIVTDSREHALSWKSRLETFLRSELKLELSLSKTLVTNVRKKYVKFLGYMFRDVKGKGKFGHITRTMPDVDRLEAKINGIIKDIKSIKGKPSKEYIISKINLFNSQIRGLINYYKCCTWVYPIFAKYAYRLRSTAWRFLKHYGGKWIRAKEVRNLPRVHARYKAQIPSVKYCDFWVGITDLSFVKWEMTLHKNQKETPYTSIGRGLNFKRTAKGRTRDRLDGYFNPRQEMAAVHTGRKGLFNYEYMMNRVYALNRDGLKCRVCGGWLANYHPWTHRIDPNLPINKINRVNNLVSLHKHCYFAINDPTSDLSKFDKKATKKIMSYRKKLGCSCKTATNKPK